MNKVTELFLDIDYEWSTDEEDVILNFVKDQLSTHIMELIAIGLAPIKEDILEIIVKEFENNDHVEYKITGRSLFQTQTKNGHGIAIAYRLQPINTNGIQLSKEYIENMWSF